MMSILKPALSNDAGFCVWKAWRLKRVKPSFFFLINDNL